MTTYQFIVSVDVEHLSGKFASRADIEEAIIAELENLSPDLDSLGADGESEYEVIDLDAEAHGTLEKKPK